MTTKKKPAKQKARGNGQKLIQSIERAVDILALFIAEKNSIGITEFAQKMKLPKTTIQGIVQTLAALHMLERDPASAKYRLGPMLFQLGMKYATNLDFVNITRGWVERLCYQYRQPVNVGMMVGDRVILVLRVEPENRFMVFPQVGSVLPAHSTSIGKMLLAHIDDARREELLRDYRFEGLTLNTITDRTSFIRELERVRSEGVSFDDQENIMGLSGVGAPLYNHTGQVVAAFALTGDTAVINEKRADIIDTIKSISKIVSDQLGYTAG
ncbi:MAG: IclR family transcriptional regulator [Spirochaetes bacterium]|nr:MAG: IclR family transcriptional regulator [Spirochaetota bacterium]